MKQITVCMGSSCFARGNEGNLEFIKNHLKESGLEKSVLLKGRLCSCNCNKGPNIAIDTEEYSNVNPSNLKPLI